jgi:SAM-dependent methyltransferase
MDDSLRKNQDWWNEVTPVHERSAFYDVKGFEAGRNVLSSIEVDEVGVVSGKSLLHLQCHFGMDTLSWARLGADVTGVDFSQKAIDLARTLASRIGAKATFIESDIYDLPNILGDQFDIVFTSKGVLCWLPDLSSWAQIVARFMKRGGVFYIYEGHPLMNVVESGNGAQSLEAKYSYFSGPGTEWPPGYDYAEQDAKISVGTCEWTHPLGEVVNALSAAGLQIEFLHEFPVLFFQATPLMTRDEAGWWHLEGDRLPLSFSIRARKD